MNNERLRHRTRSVGGMLAAAFVLVAFCSGYSGAAEPKTALDGASTDMWGTTADQSASGSRGAWLKDSKFAMFTLAILSGVVLTELFAYIWRRRRVGDRSRLESFTMEQIARSMWSLFGVAVFLTAGGMCHAEDSLPPLVGDTVPNDVVTLWNGYDPSKEPLEVEILKEWEQDGVVCRVLRYRIGVFKGKKAMMLAIYGFPTGGAKLPGLVQVHGGGQSANSNAVVLNAKRGYACISINWGGNPLNSDPNFFQGPNTDWGAVDPTQNGHTSHFFSMSPDSKTIDAVVSPRNNNAFLLILSARRALTFLENQPEVDGTKLGVYGHSIGGAIVTDVAGIDPRIKAAVPSCGGVGTEYTNIKFDGPPELVLNCIDTRAYLRHINCPILYQGPTNDFCGIIDNMFANWPAIRSKQVRYSITPHYNHCDMENRVVCSPLWFDQHLKGTFIFPQTPQTALDLKAADGIPRFSVIPDAAKPVQSIDIYYTLGADNDPTKRFWRYAKAIQQGQSWVAELPLISVDQPLRVYANVEYPLEKPVVAAGYYYQTYTAKSFSIASPLYTVTPQELQKAGIKATAKNSLLIEAFGPDWRKEWYSLATSGEWPWRTRKLHDSQWTAPEGAKLAIDVKSQQPNKLIMTLDNYSTEATLAGGDQWQTLTFQPTDFLDSRNGSSLASWRAVIELALNLGVAGPPPEFRNLRWLPASSQ